MKTIRLCALLVGVLVVLSASAAYGQVFSVVYNFGANSGDLRWPYFEGVLAQGRDGNIYGTAPWGTVNGYGGVFKLTPQGKLTVLYSFTGGTDGATPYSGLTLGTDGNFYGTTQGGGTSGGGTVFKITPAGILTTLYKFTSSTDGSGSDAPPVQGTDGNFYGTTPGGGSAGLGTIYKITPSGVFMPLYQFDHTHGSSPVDPLVLGTDGNFYGTTQHGGLTGDGVVFRITPAGKIVVLHSFDGTHGTLPTGPLVQGSDGDFYGTTEAGGSGGFGLVFKITPSGGFTVIHYMQGGSEGYRTDAGLVQATDGNLYGGNVFGGTTAPCPGCGTLFKITPDGSFSVIHNFDLLHGAAPWVSPFQHTNGLIYGDTNAGGTSLVINSKECDGDGCGVVYRWNQGLPPFVRLLPNSRKVGKVIEFLGEGFTGTTAVSFNGTPATFRVVSATYMTATVPSGATTGSVTVTTPSGILTSNQKFRVHPVVLTVAPSSAPAGTPVVITGTSFTQTTKVTFGGGKATATFTVDSDNQVTATVPAGAPAGYIVLTTTGGRSRSPDTFTVTP